MGRAIPGPLGGLQVGGNITHSFESSPRHLESWVPATWVLSKGGKAGSAGSVLMLALAACASACCPPPGWATAFHPGHWGWAGWIWPLKLLSFRKPCGLWGAWGTAALTRVKKDKRHNYLAECIFSPRCQGCRSWSSVSELMSWVILSPTSLEVCVGLPCLGPTTPLPAAGLFPCALSYLPHSLSLPLPLSLLPSCPPPVTTVCSPGQPSPRPG